MEGYWPTQPEEGVGASGIQIIYAGSQAQKHEDGTATPRCNGNGESRLQCLIGEKKMKSVRWDTSGANPMGWKYIA